MHAAIALALSLLPASTPAGSSEPGAPSPSRRRLDLTLEDCLHRALLHDPELERTRRTAAAAGERVAGARGAFEPVASASGTWSNEERPSDNALQGAAIREVTRVDATGGITQPLQTGGSVGLNYTYARDRTNDVFDVVNPATNQQLELSLTQPLLRGGWKSVATSEVRRTEITLDRAEDDRDDRELQLLIDVTSAYWDLVFVVEDRRVKELSVQRAERLLEINRRRVEVGAAPPVEVLQAEAEIALRQEDLITADNAIRAAEDVLRMLVFPFESTEEWETGITPVSPPPDPGEESAADWQKALEVALERRPDLRRAQAEVLERELDLHRARNGELPRLDLVASIASKALRGDTLDMSTIPRTPRSVDEGNLLSGEFPTGSVGLVLEFPIGNLAARARRRAAEEDLSAARQSLRGLENTIAREVRDAVRELRFLQERVEATGKSRELAARQLEAEEVKFEQGASTNFEVLQLQEDLAEALSNEKRAVLDHAKALANLRRVQGLSLL